MGLEQGLQRPVLVQLLRAQNLNTSQHISRGHKPLNEEATFHPFRHSQLTIHSSFSSYQLINYTQGNRAVSHESVVLSFCPPPSLLPPTPVSCVYTKARDQSSAEIETWMWLFQVQTMESQNSNSSCLGCRQLVWCGKTPEILLSRVPGFVHREELTLARDSSEHKLFNTNSRYGLPDTEFNTYWGCGGGCCQERIVLLLV